MKTSRKQILQSGVEKSMSSPEVFPASLFLAPDSERERKMTATSGRKCYERYGRFSPIGLLVKTLLESSQWYNPAVKLRWDVKNLCSERLTEKEYCIGRNTLSKQCVTTLNVKDISPNRLLFRLVPSERRTEETVSSLLPTVQTQGLKVCNENGKTTFYPVGLLPTPRAVEVVEHPMKAAARTKDRTGTKLNNLSSGAAFGLLPTPMASDATTGAIIGKNDQFVTTRNGTPRRINQNGQNGCVGLARMVRLLPTPNAREADKYSKKYNPNSQMGTALTAMAVNGMLPTPAARDYQPSVSPQALKRKNGKMRTDALCNLPVMLGEHHSQNGGSELKTIPMIDYILDEVNDDVLIIQGIRAAESAKRAEMSKQCTYFKYYVQPYGKDKNGKDKYHTYRRKDVLAFRKKYADDLLRPVFDWSAQQVIDYILENGIQPNPLYRMGYKRVGCFPCVMASQQDIYNISVQEPERISYIAGLEQQFNSSFFGPDKISSKYYKGEYPLISDVVRYVQSKRAGGSLFDDDVATSCMSYYGLCE